MQLKLAVVATHPIQYYAPWFSHLAQQTDLSIKVFYLWDFGVTEQVDQGFRVPINWDLPLLNGYDYEFVPNRSSNPGTASFFGLWNPGLPSLLRAWQPDAVLLMAYNFASIGYLLMRWGRGDAPLIFRGDSHRLVSRRGVAAAFKRRLTAAVFRRFAAVLYVGAANRDYFTLHGVAEGRQFHSPHAVDNERFFAARASANAAGAEWRRELGIPGNHQVILFAGKFQEIKRPLDLLEAYQSARLKDVSLLYVGSGPQGAELRSAAANLPHVYFAPFRNQTLMPSTYAAADILVLPSFSESWGLAVNEAMCMERPVIVSDRVGCARDLVLPGETGLIFRAGDVAALGQALRTAFADRQSLKSWGVRAGVHIQSYSYENASAGLLSALKHLRKALA